METREIPHDEWRSFFDVFSRQHEGWLATLEIFGPEIGAQEEAHQLPLEGVTIASGDTEPEAISISLGKTPEDHVSHTVVEPAHVWLEQTTDGANAALEIESANEVKTLLRFRSAVPSEMVDGVVRER
jgi:hypothetical protein